MKGKVTLCAALLAALFVPSAFALEYNVSGPAGGPFGTPTSQETVYVGAESVTNMDKSKNTALAPPDFGGSAGYLLGSGAPLRTDQLVGAAATYPGVPVLSSVDQSVISYTAVTQDLYYSGGCLGRLNIPKLGVNVKVYQGTDSAALAKGAGHFPDTSLWSGNVCIAGHNRGVNCYFGNIHTLTAGDIITYETKLGVRTYAVTSVSKVSETDTSGIAPTADDRLTLYTCVRDQPAYRWCVQARAV